MVEFNYQQYLILDSDMIHPYIFNTNFPVVFLLSMS
jgi:hypothetical protein